MRRRVIHAEESGLLGAFVVDEGPRRFLRFGSATGVDQSEIVRGAPGDLAVEYLQAIAAGTVVVEEPLRALVIGVGAGSYPRFLRATEPQVCIDAVENSPLVLRLARRYFGLRQNARLRTFPLDGADFLSLVPSQTYDLIVLDAYRGAVIPEHLVSASFFREARRRLVPGGAVVANVGLPELRAENEVLRAFLSVFPGSFELRTPTDDNRVAVGGKIPAHGRRELMARARAADERRPLPFERLAFARTWRPLERLRRPPKARVPRHR